MPYRLPHKGDRASAQQERLIVEQLRQQKLTQVPTVPDMFRPGLAFVAQIESVNESGGYVHYGWQALAVHYSASGEATYTELGIDGDNTDFPYLIDVGHEQYDPPIFEVNDRVVVQIIDGIEGLGYVINSRILGTKTAPIEVDKHYWVYLPVYGDATETVDERNWLGRMIWYTIAQTDWESPTVDVGGPDDPAYAGHLLVRAHYSGHDSGGAGDIVLDTVTIGAGAAEQTATLYIDQADSGKLKVDFTGTGIGNGANWRIRASGGPRLDDPDYVQVEDT